MRFAQAFLTVLMVISVAQLAGAEMLEFPMTIEFSGATPPAGTSPWLTATFDDHGSAGSVTLLLDTTGLTGVEFVGKWYFNLDPSLDPAALTFGSPSKIGMFDDPVISTSADLFKASGDGLLDIEFSFSLSETGGRRFEAGESMSIEIAGISTLTAYSFAFLSTPAGGSAGPFPTVAHVQGVGDGDEDSGWITVVPEPSTLVLLGLGAVILLAFRRRRNSRL